MPKYYRRGRSYASKRAYLRQMRAIHASYANPQRGSRKKRRPIVTQEVKQHVLKKHIQVNSLTPLTNFKQYIQGQKINREEYWKRRTALEHELASNTSLSDAYKNEAIITIAQSEDPHLQVEDSDLIFYHGTAYENADNILNNGLIGGDNTKGGTHGKFEIPTLFITPDIETAQKYGYVLKIKIPAQDWYAKYKNKAEITNDGLGDRVYILSAQDIAGKDWSHDTVIIPDGYIYDDETLNVSTE